MPYWQKHFKSFNWTMTKNEYRYNNTVDTKKTTICLDRLTSGNDRSKVQLNRCSTILIGLRHIGRPLSIDATVSAQLPQKRAWPHGTSATSERCAMRHTSHIWGSSAPAAAAEAVGGAASTGWATASSASAVSSSLALEANWKASVCAPRLWQMVCKNWRRSIQQFWKHSTACHYCYSFPANCPSPSIDDLTSCHPRTISDAGSSGRPNKPWTTFLTSVRTFQ